LRPDRGTFAVRTAESPANTHKIGEIAKDQYEATPAVRGSSMLMTIVIAAAAAAVLLLIGVRPRASRVETKRWHREIDALRSAADAAPGEHRWPDEEAHGHVRMLHRDASESRRG
jgi:hypothetical protein